MLCKQCGRPVKDGIRFCPYCGCFLAGSEPLPKCAPPKPAQKAAPAQAATAEPAAKTPRSTTKRSDGKLFDAFSIIGMVLMSVVVFFGRYLFIFQTAMIDISGETMSYCSFGIWGYVFSAGFIAAVVLAAFGARALLSKSVLMLGASILAPQAITFISESIILLIRAPGRIIGSPTVALSCVAMFLCAAALTVCAILNKRRCSCKLDPRGLTEYYLFLFVPLLGALWTVLSYVVYIPQASGAITFADPVRFYDTTKLIVAILSAAVMVGVVVMLLRSSFGKEGYICGVTVAAYSLARMIICVIYLLMDLTRIIVDGWMMIDTLWIIYIVTFATSFSLTLSVAIASGEELKKNRQ